MSGTDDIDRFEHNMFKSLKTPVKRFHVGILNKKLQIWTLSAYLNLPGIPIVLVHGLCGGIGLWLHNIDALCQSRPLYAFDLLGFGQSSRTPFSSNPLVLKKRNNNLL